MMFRKIFKINLPILFGLMRFSHSNFYYLTLLIIGLSNLIPEYTYRFNHISNWTDQLASIKLSSNRITENAQNIQKARANSSKSEFKTSRHRSWEASCLLKWFNTNCSGCSFHEDCISKNCTLNFDCENFLQVAISCWNVNYCFFLLDVKNLILNRVCWNNIMTSWW